MLIKNPARVRPVQFNPLNQPPPTTFKAWRNYYKIGWGLVILKANKLSQKGANIFNVDFGKKISSSGGCFQKNQRYFDKLPLFKN